jgi:ribosomal protein S24E
MLSSATVTWATRKQQSIATSTTEVEYVGIYNAAKEAVWIQNLSQQIGRGSYVGNTRGYVDNQNALRLIANPEFHARSKYSTTILES